ncbi:hypothetical protein PCANC_17421 [Puccinia coronata f. sp. avenae]|uniref:RING-type E3 ubiquitin transferase n=1 Tax=Puccinia coronata f. sp. avenae TaxID=200324 RepID=A0A2N5UUZ2_9BASI|nr:hypothetical protein PCASD_25008 [Puccinia coronata f. sp. avenae]PLW41573.1 hypothetical protein PCANC_17421 [Puccinia coronata f. sp. avenae]
MSSSSSSSASSPSSPSSSTTLAHSDQQHPQRTQPKPSSAAPHMDLDGAPLCRVCRSDDPSLGPLFHPCRCTGSIAHVHQDCLSTWLSHSKKSSCELCGHLFSFEKVYKPGSPERPPFTTITFQALKEIAHFFLLLSRAILVGVCWLGIVPWTVVWVSTAYWKAADWFAFGLTSNIDQLSRSSTNSSKPSTSILNSTATTADELSDPKPSIGSSSTTNHTWITHLVPSLHLDPNSIALDIFQGQLITCAIILSFVVIFLLREWILQNTPPPDLIRLPEDEELPPQPQLGQHLPAPEPDEARRPPLEPVAPATETGEEQSNDHETNHPNQTFQPNKTIESPQLIDPGTLKPLPPSQDTSDELRCTQSVPTSSPNPSSVTGVFSNTTTTWAQCDQRPSLISPTFPFSEQQVPTPGLLELADPGLGMPFYKAHDPIDPDIFSHRILVTSTYLLFIAEPSEAPSLVTPSKYPHFGDPNDSQKKLIEAWTHLAEITILHPSNAIPDSIRQLRTSVSRSLPDDHNPLAHPELEFNWTRALLSDPKISKHIQHLFNTRSRPPQTDQSQDQIRINGLVYSLLSIYNSIESQSAIHEGSPEEVECASHSHESYERIYDVMRLFVLPLLGVTNAQPRSQQLDQLEEDIDGMIQKHDPVNNLPHTRLDDPSGASSISSLKDTIVTILVKQRILASLINSPTFVRYSRGMASDDNLFTNWRLKSTRPFSQTFLNTERVINPESDLSEITIQLINFKATVAPCPKPSKQGEAVDWIDHSTIDHKLLVTSSYLLLSGEEDAETSFPVLQTPAFGNLLENSVEEDESTQLLLLKAWYKLAKSCTTKNSELLQRFKNFSSHSSTASVEDRNHSFQRLETEWLSKLLSDPSIAQFLVLILTQNPVEESMPNLGYHTPNFFLLKLVYVYTVLETPITRSSESQQTDMVYDNASKILEEHLNRLNAETPDRIHHEVLEMIRETQFLLDSCQPAKPSPNFHNSPSHDLRLRSELLITRLSRGIIGILARQKVLGMIVADRKFSKYARAMLSEPNLFSRITSLPILEQLEEEDQNVLNYERIDKGKDKASDGPQVSLEQISIPQPVRKEEESVTTPTHISESSPLDQSMDPSCRINALDSSEDTDESPSITLSTNPVENDVVSSHPDPMDSSAAHVTNIAPPESVPLAEDTKSAAQKVTSNVPETGTSAPGPQAIVERQAAPVEPLPAENIARVANPEIANRGRRQVAERAVAGRLPGFAPQRLQREAALGALGNAFGDGFVLDDMGPNAADDELMAEDIDGILELIGMKGSLLMLAQNVGLMTMLLSLSLLAFVHLPHMIGKIAVLSKAHRLLAPPFKGLLILQRYVHRMLDCLSDYVKFHLLKDYQPPAKLQKLWSLAGSPEKSFSGLSQWLNRWPFTELVRVTNNLTDQGRSLLSSLFSFDTLWHEIIDRVGDRLNSIAYGSKPIDRALAVLLGYFELVLMSLLYLSSGLDQQRARFVSETIVNGIQQQLLIGKVGVFIFVELVIFPFLCGLLLNLTTIPIFANATMTNRLELYSSSPYSATLITWLVGTCFMFSFALLVSTCRESLRAGVCWWIRDPADDRFNPIREILDRSAWSQTKKIFASAIMYGAVVVFGLGSIVFNLVFFTGTLPLRIHADRSISSSALDLVIYQTFLPFFLECFQPRTKLKECLQAISRSMARRLRLTCYLYGERRIAEETTLEVVVFGSDGQVRPLEKRARFSPMRLFRSYHQCSSTSTGGKGKGVADPSSSSPSVSKGAVSRRRKWAGGSFARVPASDAVKVVPGRKMHIPVHVDGTPIDPADMEIIEQQQAEAREEGGGAAGGEQYTVVYLPPQFRTRMLVFVVSMWSAAVVLGWLAIGIPLLVGRILLDRFFMPDQQEPHDVYAYAIGMLTCAVLLTLGSKAWALYSSLCQLSSSSTRETGWGTDQKGEWDSSESEEEYSEEEEEEEEEDAEEDGLAGAAGNGVRAHRPVWKQMGVALKAGVHFLLLFLAGGIVLPILTSVVVELYVLGLVKWKQPSVPSVYLLEAWTYGCIYLSIAARLVRLALPTHSISVAMEQIVAHWRAGEVGQAAEKINGKLVGPLMLRLVLLVGVPFVLVQPLVLLLLRRDGAAGTAAAAAAGGMGRGGTTKAVVRWLVGGAREAPGHPYETAAAAAAAPADLSLHILRLVYPLILSWISQLALAKLFVHFFASWIEKVRDERFLEKRRLRNYEPEPPNPSASAPSSDVK